MAVEQLLQRQRMEDLEKIEEETIKLGDIEIGTQIEKEKLRQAQNQAHHKGEVARNL